jgi:chlorite dismutase
VWKCSRNTPPFLFLKTSSGRYPAWRQIYVEMNGEAAAEKITAETPVFYGYRVDVAT